LPVLEIEDPVLFHDLGLLGPVAANAAIDLESSLAAP